ncbi:acyl carrier protein [Actinoplanes sp. TFC3]|uniref:acyl carrier protein n=1 Tax=Actinoplanes sp. TFC3 TaxID=1710355 RepID=UPI00082970B2|nr:acyl carrier protein [Actinoplanes sp. TFC3]
MSICTLGELTDLIRETLGGDDSVDLDRDIHDVALFDLGVDSLAKLELAAALRHRYGIAFSDEVLDTLETPGDFLATINRNLVAVA